MVVMSISNSLNILPIEYSLQTYHRSNQDTTLVHRPVVNEGDWVQAGDLISDSASSIGGEFSIGQNLLIAYLPWEGYNYEDAILISERLVYDDLYTSIHIERYDISTEKTPHGNEIITKEILLLKDTTELEHLDENGVAKLGSWLKEGDILVGKITPTEPKKEVARYIQLYNDILGKKMDYSFRDTSLRVPRGLEAKVIRVQLFPEKKNTSTKLSFLKKKSLLKSKKVKGYKIRIDPSYLRIYYKDLNIKQMVKLPKMGNLTRVNLVEARTTKKNNGLKAARLSKNRRANFGIHKPKLVLGRKLLKKLFFKVFSSRPFFILPQLDVSQFFLAVFLAKRPRNIQDISRQKSQKKEKKQKDELLKDRCFFVEKKKRGDTRANFNPESHFVRFFFRRKKIRKEKRKRREWSYLFFSKRKTALFFTKAFSTFSKYGNLSHKLFSTLVEKRHPTFFLKNKARTEIGGQKVKLFYTESVSERTPSVKTDLQNSSIVKNNFEQKKQKRKTPKSSSRNSKNLREDKFVTGGSMISRPEKKIKSQESTSINSVHVYLAEKRKVQVGDKMAGRHGNKGIISQILPRQDMPYLPDGSPIDLALNPLGVPSRMNVGQIYECLLGLAGKNLGEQYRIKPFDEAFGSEASRSFVFSKLYEARIKTGQSWLFQPVNPGKLKLFDGRTGNIYDQPITTGYSYMIKLVHLVDEKIHSRSSGPYSLITQQPLKGRSKHGGQRLGEMEVWAIEAYGAAFILLELLTIKSDDVTGRLTIWDYILYKKPLYIGTPASFKVLICELQALCLDIGIYKADSANNLKQLNVSTMG